MPIQFQCTWCGKKINAGDAFAGKSAKCPGCGGVVQVPAASEPPPAASGGFGDFPAPNQPPQFGAQNFGPPPSVGPASPGGSIGPPPGGVFDAEDFSAAPPSAAPASGDERRPCPACGEMIMQTAAKCRFCGEVFDSTLRRTGGKGRNKAGEEMTGFDWFLVILCPGIGCIVGIVRLIQGKGSGGKMLGLSIAFAIGWNVLSALLQALTQVR